MKKYNFIISLNFKDLVARLCFLRLLMRSHRSKQQIIMHLRSANRVYPLRSAVGVVATMASVTSLAYSSLAKYSRTKLEVKVLDDRNNSTFGAIGFEPFKELCGTQ